MQLKKNETNHRGGKYQENLRYIEISVKSWNMPSHGYRRRREKGGSKRIFEEIVVVE